MPSLDHVHIYVFMEKRNGIDYYKCDHPRCTHFTRKETVVNKSSVCSKCRIKEVILTRKHLHDRKNPLCLDCQATRQGKVYKEGKDVMENILNTIEEKLL